jgi:uncharacterized membrane protein YiaA
MTQAGGIMPDKPDDKDANKDHYERTVKSANYLLVAHGAGLVGCLSVIKDYANVPQLKGLGFFIALFGIGLLGAIAYYALATFSIMFAAAQTEIKSKAEYRGLIALSHLGVWGAIISLATLVIAVVAIIVRFWSL